MFYFQALKRNLKLMLHFNCYISVFTILVRLLLILYKLALSVVYVGIILLTFWWL